MKEIHYKTIIISVLLLTFCVIRYTFHVAAEQKDLSVTATVAASAGDFQTSTARLTAGTSFPQSTTIEYEITYGSNLSTSVNFTLEASWTEGTIGSSSSTVDIVDYVTNAATTCYGSISPVIDLTNKKIAWEFSSFPASTTDQTVRFSLKTNSTYTGAEAVSFNVKSKIIGPGVTTTASTVSTSYLYEADTTSPTATPGTGPSATPGPGPTSTPTPTPNPLTFSNIAIDALLDSEAEISFSTPVPITYTLAYGLKPSELSTVLSSPLFLQYHTITLRNLDPNTRYYFKIIAQDASGKKIASDVFTFLTAQPGALGPLLPEQVSVQRKKIPLIGGTIKRVITSPSRPITIRVDSEDGSKIKSMKARFINALVLGISTDEPAAHVAQTGLIEILPNLFIGELLTPRQRGSYLLEVTTSDVYGGIRKQRLAITFVNGDPITVIDGTSKEPIEGAHIKVARYDTRTNAYIPLDLGIPLTQETDQHGNLDIMLPLGTYQLEVSAAGYFSQKYVLKLTDKTTSYPVVALSENTALSESFRYIRNSYDDISTYLTKNYIELLQSKRAHDLALSLSIILFLILVSLNSTETISHRHIIKQAAKHHHVTFLVWIMRIFFIGGSFLAIITAFISMPFYFVAQEPLKGIVICILALLNSILWIRYTGLKWKESES